MRSIEAALAVDYARRGAWIIGVLLLCITAIPLWIYTALRFDGPFSGDGPEGVAMHVTLTLVMGFGAAIAVFQSQGKLARHFVRPVSAARLVSCQMAFGIVTIVGMYVIATCILNLNGAEWPVVGPALFLAAALACSLAAIWSLEGTIMGQLIACILTTTPLVIWFNRCYGARVFGDWQRMWVNPTAVEALTLGAITAVAYAVAVAGVTRVRRGDAWDFATFHAWCERQFASLYRAPRLNGAFAAQLWLEWRQKISPVGAIMVAAFLLFIFVLWLLGSTDVKATVHLARGLPVLILSFVMPLIFGLVAGNCSIEHGNKGMRYLLATRPVTSQSIAMAILRNCAAGLLSAWGTWLIGFLALSACIYGAGYHNEFEEAIWSTKEMSRTSLNQLAVISIVLLLISWTLTSLMATMVATGRVWLWLVVLFTLFGTVLGVALAKGYLHPHTFETLTFGGLIFCGSAFLVATVIAFVAAVRLRLISSSIIIPAVLWWSIAVAVSLYISVRVMNPDPAWLVYCVGVLALSNLPFAAMPLAVRWNRHR